MAETSEHWKEHLERAKATGLTGAEYCRQNGLNKNLFGYWKKKLGMAVQRGPRRSGGGFVEVPETLKRRAEKTAALEIRIAGVELDLRIDFDRLLR